MGDREHHLWGVRLDDIAIEDLREKLRSSLGAERPIIVVTPNPEFLMMARADETYRDVLNRADLSVPDGVGLRYAIAAHSEDRLNNRHIGVDVVELLAGIAQETSASFVLLGGFHPFLERARQYFTMQHQGLRCTAINPGFVPDELGVDLVSHNVIHQLEVIDAKIIAVGLGRGRGRGQGKQERYLHELAAKFPQARIIIGVGGAIDYFGSAVSRAPKLWRNLGFEWLWRIGAEPWRIRRVGNAVIVFPILIAWDTLTSGQFIAATRRVFQELSLLFRKV